MTVFIERNMDEGNSEDDRDNANGNNEQSKRLKTEDNNVSPGQSVEESSSSSAAKSPDEGETSPSQESTFEPATRRTAQYRRNKQDESSNNEGSDGDASTSTDEPMVHTMDSQSTLILDTDRESDADENPVLDAEKPKHTWFVVPELINRQIGTKSKLRSNELFQRRCYGSLHAVQRLELMYKLEEHNGCVNSLNFHPTGSYLASGSDDLKVIVWDWKVGRSLIKYKSKHRGNVFQSKFLHLTGDLHIASCARDGQVRLAQVSMDGVRDNRLLGNHRGPCHKLIVLPEQPHIIISVGEDSMIYKHDVRTPKSTKITNVENYEGKVALYSIHGHPLRMNEFVVSGNDEYVRTYDDRNASTVLATYIPFSRNSQKRSNSFSDYNVTCAVYNYNGSEILASYSDNDIYLFDVNQSKMGDYIHSYQGHRNGATIKGVNFFGPKSEYVVSGSDCGHVYFWDRNTEAIVQWLLADDSGVVNCLEPHPQLPFICTSGLDWDIKVWVPSCEHEPVMDGLWRTVKNNNKSKINYPGASDPNDGQIVWALWRHLRNRNLRRLTLSDDFLFHLSPSSSSSSSSVYESESNAEFDADEMELDGPPGCATS